MQPSETTFNVGIVKAGNISACRKPSVLFNDGEHFPIEISFRREITNRELEAIAALAQVIDESKGVERRAPD